ncbi:hypothetical protein ACFX13_012797 [Malus domestica]
MHGCTRKSSRQQRKEEDIKNGARDTDGEWSDMSKKGDKHQEQEEKLPSSQTMGMETTTSSRTDRLER